jgi:hypothetical protein
MLGATETYVIDPRCSSSRYRRRTGPAFGDPGAVLVPTDASIFYRSSTGTTQSDPTYVQTNAVLTTYRNELKLRTAGASGPPPYLSCMVPGRGVQWLGTIAGGVTHRWFTWGWPATWHVLWTLMPLTTCGGGPKLSWRVQVERPSAADCTYWITVTNLTNDVLRFEGRFDIL